MRSAEKRWGSELYSRSEEDLALAGRQHAHQLQRLGIDVFQPANHVHQRGKKHTMAAIVILGSMPLPMISTRIGALATIGIELIMPATG